MYVGVGIRKAVAAAVTGSVRRSLHDFAHADEHLIRVLYADAGMLVVEKPPGLLSVPGIGETKLTRNLTTILQRWLRERPDHLATLCGLPSAFQTISLLQQNQAIIDYTQSALEMSPNAPVQSARSRRKARKASLREGTLPFVVTPSLLSIQESPRIPMDYQVYPRTVHRLDEATSGLVVFGLTAAIQRALSIQFTARCVTKTYEAVLDARAIEELDSPIVNKDAGVIETSLPTTCREEFLIPSSFNSGGCAVAPACLPCMTHWKVLSRECGSIHVALTPLTGRTHQLRLHCALPPPFGLGAPIRGDAFYGDPSGVGDTLFFALLASGTLRDGNTSMIQHIDKTVQTLGKSGVPTRQACRLMLHAGHLQLVDYFNYAHQVTRGEELACTSATIQSAHLSHEVILPSQERFCITVDVHPTRVDSTIGQVDDRGDGHYRARRVVNFRSI